MTGEGGINHIFVLGRDYALASSVITGLLVSSKTCNYLGSSIVLMCEMSIHPGKAEQSYVAKYWTHSIYSKQLGHRVCGWMTLFWLQLKRMLVPVEGSGRVRR